MGVRLIYLREFYTVISNNYDGEYLTEFMSYILKIDNGLSLVIRALMKL